MINSKKFSYQYNALENLNSLNKLNTINIENQINLCIYEILYSETEKHPPFLRYFLEKDKSGILSFPKISKTSDKKEGLEDQINDFFQILLLSKHLSFSKKDLFIMNGYYQDLLSDIYLFIDVTNMKINLDVSYQNNISFNNNYWLATIHEIVNEKKIGNLQIDKKISNFFTRNIDFNFLQNEINIDYEIPIIGYLSKPFSKLEYTYVFGLSYSDLKPEYLNYYYFTDYEEALKDSLKFQEDKKGIIRFALFTGKIILIENKNELLENTKELLDLKNDYNTIQINSENISLFLIKNVSQQIPLSFHLIV